MSTNGQDLDLTPFPPRSSGRRSGDLIALSKNKTLRWVAGALWSILGVTAGGYAYTKDAWFVPTPAWKVTTDSDISDLKTRVQHLEDGQKRIEGILTDIRDDVRELRQVILADRRHGSSGKTE